MAKSRSRGGAKAHRKRVLKRNTELGIAKKKFQKVFTEMYETKMKEIQEKFEKMSGLTETEGEAVITEEKTESSEGQG